MVHNKLSKLHSQLTVTLSQDCVEELIEENVISSKRYTDLQNKHVTAKNQYQTIIGRKLDLEIGVTEITKVSGSNLKLVHRLY